MPSNAGSLALETEADGRRYAIALLEAFEKEVIEAKERGFAVYAAATEGEAEPGVICIYRDRPQTDTLKRWVSELYARGTPARLGGFFTWGPTTSAAGLPARWVKRRSTASRNKRARSIHRAHEIPSAGAGTTRLAKGEKLYRLG